jgi:predicted N-acyltransferase
LLAGARALCSEAEASSVHITFLTEDEWREFGGKDWLQRTDTQFHWHNQGYVSFDDFLATLSHNHRKNLRKERRAIAESGISIEWVTGSEISESHWDAFFDFYMDTGSRKWGTPYLTREFFSLIGAAMPQNILLVMCKRAGRYIAGALNFIGSDTLYGRNWGALEHHPFLHFEACYYQAIDFAIARGLKTVEAGAQGAHKLARGYLPATTYSLHHLADPRLARAIADYLAREREAVADNQAELDALSPFRKPSA